MEKAIKEVNEFRGTDLLENYKAQADWWEERKQIYSDAIELLQSKSVPSM